MLLVLVVQQGGVLVVDAEELPASCVENAVRLCCWEQKKEGIVVVPVTSIGSVKYS